MKPRLTLLTALLLMPQAALSAADESAARLLPLTPEFAMQLERAQKAGLVEIAPVRRAAI